jgi:hypothetical protein
MAWRADDDDDDDDDDEMRLADDKRPVDSEVNELTGPTMRSKDRTRDFMIIAPFVCFCIVSDRWMYNDIIIILL